jgi:colanic acid/amylovoran biosynthesis protein
MREDGDLNIEIIGIWPANKGALLMLEAVRAKLAETLPRARLAVPVSWAADDRLAHGLWATPGGEKLPRSIAFFDRAPTPLRARLGYLREEEIDVLLDASGFGYGDAWGHDKLAQRLAKRLDVWKTGSRKAVMLPQALGPFERPGMAETFGSALDRLDLVFVRDAASAAYVEAVAPGRPNLRRAPDFTNLLHPALPPALEALRGRSVVIPNEKLVSGKGDEVRCTYREFLKLAIERLRSAGHDPVLLVHEGAKDRALASEVAQTLAAPIQIVDHPSALVTKAIVSAAAVAVSSRFHGLVSALSAAVPSLSCGWSHKYRELMRDYGSEELTLLLDKRDSWDAALSLLIERAGDPAFRETLRAHGEKQRAASEAMWGEVLECIA